MIEEKTAIELFKEEGIFFKKKKLFAKGKFKRYRNRFPNFRNWVKWGCNNKFLHLQYLLHNIIDE